MLNNYLQTTAIIYKHLISVTPLQTLTINAFLSIFALKYIIRINAIAFIRMLGLM